MTPCSGALGTSVQKDLNHGRRIVVGLFDHFVADFPEGRRPCGTVDVVVLVEPVAQDTPGGAYAADLYAFGPPALLFHAKQKTR